MLVFNLCMDQDTLRHHKFAYDCLDLTEKCITTLSDLYKCKIRYIVMYMWKHLQHTGLSVISKPHIIFTLSPCKQNRNLSS